MLTLWIIIAVLHLTITTFLSWKIGTWKSIQTTQRPSLSIIIAARNEAENLRLLIPRIIEQTYPDFEIIVGLDRCSDDSLRYLTSLDSANVKWVEITETPLGWNSKKHALNEAIKLATGEWLVFTDADCIPATNKWLESVAKEAANKTDIVLGISPYVSHSDLLSKYIQFEAFMTAFMYASFTLAGMPYMAVGRNFAVRKTLFLDQGGYDSIKSIAGGDDDLFIQKNATSVNTRLALGPDALVFTRPSTTWTAYLQQKLRHYSVSSSYSFSSQLLLTFYHLSHGLTLLGLVMYWNAGYLLPILLFYLLIKLGSYRFASNKMGSEFNYILLPIVDVTYAFLTPVIGIWSKFKKDIKWKN